MAGQALAGRTRCVGQGRAGSPPGNRVSSKGI